MLKAREAVGIRQGPPDQMQGVLYKWTNYLSGWQPRWFILEAGILSYYLSSDEVTQGCRGSVKVASCEISVHPHDQTRLDIAAPGGRHIFIRASSTIERQQWLIALGYAKQSDLPLDSIRSIEPAIDDQAKKKMAELHLTCQQLISQVAGIKDAASEPQPNVKTLSELSNAVSSTCDTFLDQLTTCMELGRHGNPPTPNLHSKATMRASGQNSLNSFSEDELHQPPSPHPLPHPLPHLQHPHKQPSKLNQKRKSPYRASPSTPPPITPSHLPPSTSSLPPHLSGSVEAMEVELKKRVTFEGYPNDMPDTGVDMATVMSDSSSTTQSPSRSNSDLFLTPTSSPSHTPPPSPGGRVERSEGVSVSGEGVMVRSKLIRKRIQLPLRSRKSAVESLFSRIPEGQRFESLMLADEEGIPMEEFLACCRAAVPFFDTINATAFAPVKADINGNINKLSQRFAEDPRGHVTLQAMVKQELSTNTHTARNSGTDALLWLKRAMEFIQIFISEVAGGEKSLDVAAGKAYTKSLRRFHNWIIRGMFSLAVKAVPYYPDFVLMLGGDGQEESEEDIVADMAIFAGSLGELISILNQFYQLHGLDPPPLDT